MRQTEGGEEGKGEATGEDGETGEEKRRGGGGEKDERAGEGGSTPKLSRSVPARSSNGLLAHDHSLPPTTSDPVHESFRKYVETRDHESSEKDYHVVLAVIVCQEAVFRKHCMRIDTTLKRTAL